MKVELDDVSWLRMAEGVEKVRRRLLLAAQALRSAAVPYAVVGGNAIAAWVSRVDEAAVRNTRDVDLLLRRQDFPRAKEALENAGFIYRQVSALGRAGHLDLFLDSPHGKARDALHIVWAKEKVNPEMPEPVGDITGAEESGGFALVPLEQLVRMKLAAFRDRDRVHLRDLIDVGLVDERWLTRLPRVLAQRLRSIFDTPAG
jgi:hypothetical protein